VHGDDYVSGLAVMGCLEGMQMATVTSRGVDFEAFRPWLRPLPAKYWDPINRFWQEGVTIPTIHSD